MYSTKDSYSEYANNIYKSSRKKMQNFKWTIQWSFNGQLIKGDMPRLISMWKCFRHH